MILAISLDGLLRIRRQSNLAAVVELRSPAFPGDWTYCVWRSCPIDEAWTLFLNQCLHHLDPHNYMDSIVQPGV